jgi:streptogramin lyase
MTRPADLAAISSTRHEAEQRHQSGTLIDSHSQEGVAMSRSEAPAIWEIVVTDKGAGPYGIAAGPDGALWLTFALGCAGLACWSVSALPGSCPAG